MNLLRLNGNGAQRETDALAEEEPLEIRARGRAISVTMRTPGHDAELAAGFLLTEGLIRCASDVVRIDPCDRNEFGNVINVVLAPEIAIDFGQLTRHVFAASSCGLCGKASIETIRQKLPRIALTDLPSVSREIISGLPRIMQAAQQGFAQTGGVHAAALFDERGNLLVLREDVGRHNAVDKVLGHALIAGWLPLSRHVLLVSGRSSFEIMQKALAGGVPIVAAVSAPSALAVRFAIESGQTLIGFLRENRMNIYSGPQRIGFAESEAI